MNPAAPAVSFDRQSNKLTHLMRCFFLMLNLNHVFLKYKSAVGNVGPEILGMGFTAKCGKQQLSNNFQEDFCLKDITHKELVYKFSFNYFISIA